jgi:hypothetical protein
MTIPERPISLAEMIEACDCMVAETEARYGYEEPLPIALRAAASVLRQVERGELVPAEHVRIALRRGGLMP